MEHNLTRRERQIMDILFAAGAATVNQIRDQLPDPPTPTAVRTLLKILDNKGLIKRIKQGREFLYSPRPQRIRAGQSAMQRVIHTFFNGSLEKAVGAYLLTQDDPLSEEERRRLLQLIEDSTSSNS